MEEVITAAFVCRYLVGSWSDGPCFSDPWTMELADLDDAPGVFACASALRVP
jgi:hypothetical protein